MVLLTSFSLLENGSQFSYALHSSSHPKAIVFLCSQIIELFIDLFVNNILWFSIICFMEVFCFVYLDWIYLAMLHDVTTMKSEQTFQIKPGGVCRNWAGGRWRQKQSCSNRQTFYQGGVRLGNCKKSSFSIWAGYGCAHGWGIYLQHILVQRQL